MAVDPKLMEFDFDRSHSLQTNNNQELKMRQVRMPTPTDHNPSKIISGPEFK